MTDGCANSRVPFRFHWGHLFSFGVIRASTASADATLLHEVHLQLDHIDQQLHEVWLSSEPTLRVSNPIRINGDISRPRRMVQPPRGISGNIQPSSLAEQ
uniref:Uncharacterized protein n=1 Tax=Ditylenchus dipsaci TaxID=166011 RepID=A0A915E3F4_9BILA